MGLRLPFRNLEPTFFAGLLDDPLLLVRVRPAGENLLFDCGQVHHLAKRVMTALQAIFISHTHMDHWMGIDSIIRHLHASPKSIDLFGPPGLADKLGHKLAGYDWNLAEDYWGNFCVHDIHQQQMERSLFRGSRGFSREPLEPLAFEDRIIYRRPHLKVRAESCDHRVNSLIYRIDEQPTFLIDRDKLGQLGLIPGPWLGELKRYFFTGVLPDSGLRVLRLSPQGPRATPIENPANLTHQLQRPQPTASIGYISDVGFNSANREKIIGMMAGVDLLLCECTFLAEAQDRARTSFHLCTADVNRLLAELKPRYFLPMHLSKSYSRNTEALYQELNPQAETTLLKLPRLRTPRPLLAREISWSWGDQG